MIQAIILADSIPCGRTSERIVTFELTLPRAILAQLNTHRVASRNTASTRAIPVSRMIAAVTEHPWIPTKFGKNQPGMSASEELQGAELEDAVKEWLAARDSAVQHARNFEKLGVHKEISNQVISPFMWSRSIFTIRYKHLPHMLAQRDHKDAQPDFEVLAGKMRDAVRASKPRDIPFGEWHLPLVEPEEMEGSMLDRDQWVQVSAGRCAAVSYDRHQQKNPAKDIFRCLSLIESHHMSPLEHQACATSRVSDPWVLYRKTIPNEDAYDKVVGYEL